MSITSAIAFVTFALGAGLAGWATVIDARTHRLPNKLVAPLAAVGVVGLTAASIGDSWLGLPPLLLGALAFAGPWFLVHLISPRAIGFGDVKFAAALGIYIGWFDPVAGLWACALTLLAAWPHSVTLLIRKSGKTVPLGPYLLVGAVAAALLS